MIKNFKLYGYLMNFIDKVIETYIDDNYNYINEEEYEKIDKELRELYITEASIVEIWEEISPMWREILEKLEVEKYFK